MFDHDDLNNIGRAAQLNSQEKTRQAILDLQKKEARMPKCPWCAGPIEKNVSKCRHCTSDIEWVNITHLEPCKPTDKRAVGSRQGAESRKKAKKQQDLAAAQNAIVTCDGCGKKARRRDTDTVEDISPPGRVLCKPCSQARRDKENLILWIAMPGLLIFIIGFIWWLLWAFGAFM